MGLQATRLGVRALIYVASAYAACAAAMLWPVLRRPGASIPMDTGDPALTAAILYWNATVVPLSRDWWNFPSFAPLHGVTSFTEHLLASWPLASPIIWVTGNPVAAYNLTLFLSLVASGTAMFALGYGLTGSAPAALAAGAAFAFSPYLGNHYSHLQIMMTFGMPVALLGLHVFVSTGRRIGLVWFAIGWVLSGLANNYLLVLFGTFVVLWIAWFCSTARHIRCVPALALAGVTAMLPLVPIVVGYLRVHSQHQLTRSISEMAAFSADFTGIFHPGLPLAFSSWMQPIAHEGAIFPGLTIVLAAAIAVLWPSADETRWAPRLGRAALLAVALACFLLAAVALGEGLRFAVSNIRVSITDPVRPIIAGLLATAAWLWLARGSLRRSLSGDRSPIAFYTLMVVVMWLLSLGPIIHLEGREIADNALYRALLLIPGVNGIRAPARFWLVATLALAVLVGFGVAKVTRRGSWIPGLMVTAGIVLEGWVNVAAIPINPFPPFTPLEADAVTLELPIDRAEVNTMALLRASVGQYRTLNGYSGYEPRHFKILRQGMQARDASVVAELRRHFTLYMSTPWADVDDWRGWLGRASSDRYSGSADRDFFRFPRRRGNLPAPMPVLPFTIASTSCAHTPARLVADDSYETRWHCGSATGGQQITLDLGRAVPVSGVNPSLGAFVTDAPARLRVDASIDGGSWQEAWSGAAWGAALRGALADSGRTDVVITFPPKRARFIRLTQTAAPGDSYWSIAELQVFGESPPLSP